MTACMYSPAFYDQKIAKNRNSIIINIQNSAGRRRAKIDYKQGAETIDYVQTILTLLFSLAQSVLRAWVGEEEERSSGSMVDGF